MYFFGWTIYQHARNIGTKQHPHYVTVWEGRDVEGKKRWLVRRTTANDGSLSGLFGIVDDPNRCDPATLPEAIMQYYEDNAIPSPTEV